jgi:hypothetical protein
MQRDIVERLAQRRLTRGDRRCSPPRQLPMPE